MEEVWKHIPGTGKAYSASTHGRIMTHLKIAGKHSYEIDPSVRRLLHLSKDEAGYSQLTIGRPVRKSWRVHTLVLITFVGPRPGGMCCAHLNGKRHDNRLENLKWCTPKENHSHKLLHGTAQRGEKNPTSTWTEKEVLRARRLYKSGLVASKVAEKMGKTPNNVYKIVSGASWGWLRG